MMKPSEMRPSTISPGAHANEHTQTHTNTSAHTHKHRAHAGTGTGATTSTSAHEPRIHAHTPRGTHEQAGHTRTRSKRTDGAPHARAHRAALAPCRGTPCPAPRTTGIEPMETPLPANPPRPTRLKAPSTPLFGLRRMGMTPGTWHAGYGARGAIELACAAGGVLQRAAPEAHLGPSRDKIAILGKISFYATLKSHKRTSRPGDGHNVTKNMFQWI